MLLLGVMNLPIEYYTFLRIVVTIGTICVILKEHSDGIIWQVIFGVMAILFNPIIPVYLYSKSLWIPLDIVAAILFTIKLFNLKNTKNE